MRFGNHHFEPAQSGARDGVVDTGICDRTADNEGVDLSEPQEVVQVRTVEGVGADLADHQLVREQRKLFDYLPTPRAGSGVLRPDLSLRVNLVVRVLREDDLHPALPGKIQQVPYRRYGSLRVGED